MLTISAVVLVVVEVVLVALVRGVANSANNSSCSVGGSGYRTSCASAGGCRSSSISSSFSGTSNYVLMLEYYLSKSNCHGSSNCICLSCSSVRGQCPSMSLCKTVLEETRALFTASRNSGIV